MSSQNPAPEQPRIPGVRYRTETRYRPVTTHVFGEEQTDYEPYEVEVPIPPRDYDRYLMRFLMAVAMVSTVIAVVWSTASISRLLSLVVTTPGIAIAGASLFELLWIVCLVAEWLMRGQPDRAKPMQIAGWIAVTFVVTAVIVEGFHEQERAAGIVGGAVSLMAKGSWWVVFRVRQVKLRRPIASWLQRNLEDIAAAEALLAFKQQIGGRQAYASASYGADELQAARTTVEAVNRLQQLAASEPVPVVPPAPQPPMQPSGQPVQPPPPPAQVPAPVVPVPQAPVLPVSGQGVPVSGPVSGQGQEPAQPVAQIGGSIAGAIRALLAEHPAWEGDQHLDDLVKAVEAACGPRPGLADTVRRTRDRQLKKQKRTA